MLLYDLWYQLQTFAQFKINYRTIPLAIAVYYLIGWASRILRIIRVSSTVHSPKLGFFFQLKRFCGQYEELFEKITTLCAENRHYGMIKVWAGDRLLFMVKTPEDLEIIENSTHVMGKNPLVYNTIVEFVGKYGLLMSPYPIWKRHKLAILPTLSKGNLDNYQEVFAQFAKEAVANLNNTENDTISTDMVLKHTHYFVDSCLYETLFGINRKNYDLAEVSHHFDQCWNVILKRLTNIRFQLQSYFFFTEERKNYKKSLKYIKTFMNKLIEQKKEELENRKQYERQCPEAEICDAKKPNRKAFLEHLVELSAENKFTRQEIADELITFIIAGSDTLKITIGMILEMIAMHRDVQQRVYEEVMEKIGDADEINSNDVARLEYTHRVIMETTRLFPAGPTPFRRCDGDIKTTSGTIPAGSDVMLAVFDVQRNPKYWPDPLRFDPDRFLPENSTNRHSYAYNTFVGGIKPCIGKHFAMLQMKTLVAYIIRQFAISTEYQSPEDIRLYVNVGLHPRDGHKTTFKLRPTL